MDDALRDDWKLTLLGTPGFWSDEDHRLQMRNWAEHYAKYLMRYFAAFADGYDDIGAIVRCARNAGHWANIVLDLEAGRSNRCDLPCPTRAAYSQ
jgi:hypothetical protein